MNTQNRPENSSPPLVIAHRGASASHPENTIEAFAAAADQGADWVELDVRRTADGALAVHHDPHLADGRAIVDCAAADLPASVPDLAAAVRACGSMGVNVEIKNDPGEPDWDPTHAVARAAMPVIADLLAPDRVLVTSFTPGDVDLVAALDPEMPTGLLTVATGADVLRDLEAAHRGGHVAYHPHVATVTAELIERAHELGLILNTWTIDDPDRIAELAGFGIDGVVTNDPALGRRVIDSL